MEKKKNVEKTATTKRYGKLTAAKMTQPKPQSTRNAGAKTGKKGAAEKPALPRAAVGRKVRAAKAQAAPAQTEKTVKTGKKTKQKNTPGKFATPLTIAFLGGLEEVGKNMTVLSVGDDMIIVDCGLAFPDESMPGVDLVIPDFTYIEKNANRVRGIFITHGHEDHIGGLVYLLKTLNIPVYATKLTCGLIEGKLREHRMLSKVKLNVIKPGDSVKCGQFRVEAIHVNHSIPDAVAFAIHNPAGTVIMTGDYKIDPTPIDGEMMDLARFGQLGNEGVLALLSDSTNAERPGYTPSESTVGATFENLFRRAGKKRIIVATFASNIHRVQQIIDVAVSLGRKVALSGRSLENVVAVSTELGYLNVPAGVLIGIDDIRRYRDDQLVLITTGSQGEPMSALSRMAMSDHRKVAITSNDCVIISARPIPGNEKTVGNVINELMKLGAQVVYESMYDVHVSGHACQQEDKILLGLVKPRFFIPVHGETKQLRKHAELGEQMGIPAERIVVPDNGTAVTLVSPDQYKLSDVPAGRVFVDGYGVGNVGSTILRERKLLAEDGVIVVWAVIDQVTGYPMGDISVDSRGFVYARSSSDLFADAAAAAQRVIDEYCRKGRHDVDALRSKVKDAVSRSVYEKTKRSPMVIPVIEEV